MNGRSKPEQHTPSGSKPFFFQIEYLTVAFAIVFFIVMIALRAHFNEKNETERKQREAIARATRTEEDQLISLEKKKEAEEKNQENDKELEIVIGIPKDQRKTIYREYMDRVWEIEKEADRRYQPGIDDNLNREFYRKEFNRQTKLLCEKYKISEKQLSVIHWEGEEEQLAKVTEKADR